MTILQAQRDSAWSLKKLGYGAGTIGQFGCVITSISMCLREKGYDVNPIIINDKLKAITNGFVAPSSDPTQKNLVNWDLLNKVFPQLEFTGRFDYNTVAAPLDKLKAYLDQGYSVILKMSGVTIGGRGDHFVKAEAVVNNNVIIQDPWNNYEGLLTDKFTYSWADTAAEIITGFRVMKITPAQGDDNMNEDEMIVKKTLFAELVDKSTQRDDIYRYFVVDLGSNQVSEIKKRIDELKAQKQNCSIDLDASKKKVVELAEQVQTANAVANSRKDTLVYIAEKLGVSSDESVIKGAVEELVNVDDKLEAAHRKISELNEEHSQEKAELLKKISTLSDQIDEWKKKADDLQKDLDILKEEVGEVSDDENKTSVIKKIVDEVVTFLRKLIKRQEEQEKLNNTTKEDNDN